MTQHFSDLIPAERTDAVLKAAIQKDVYAIAYLTCAEEKRLSKFILRQIIENARVSRPGHLFAQACLVKDQALRDACKTAAYSRMVEEHAKPLTERLAKVKAAPSAIFLLTADEIEANAELAVSCIAKCEGAYFALPVRTAFFSQVYYFGTQKAPSKPFMAIPAEFQTERMILHAIKQDPKYFQYVAYPTAKALDALFDAHRDLSLAELIQWIPESMNLDGMTLNPEDPNGRVARIKAERARLAEEKKARLVLRIKVGEKAKTPCDTCKGAHATPTCPAEIPTVVPTSGPAVAHDTPGLERFEADWLLAQLTKPTNQAILTKVLPDLRKLVGEALPKPIRAATAKTGVAKPKRAGTTGPKKVVVK